MTGKRLHILRLTIEAETPLSIGSGEEVTHEVLVHKDGRMVATQIMALMRDANGLPGIPGASVQGALRHLIAEIEGKQEARRLFGHEDRDGTGQTGRISFSWGAVHDATDTAVTGLRYLAGTNDGILKVLGNNVPLHRDHVALNAWHSVDERRKFARNAVPAGTRFSFQFEAWGNDQAEQDLRLIAQMFAHPDLRLGGGSAAGYGRIRVIRASLARPDLARADELRRLRGAPPSEAFGNDGTDIVSAQEPLASDSRATTATLMLDFDDALRIGGATPPDGTPGDDRFKTLWVRRDTRFVWENGQGRDEMVFGLPGSAFRGPLAHRMAYYAHRVANRVIDVDQWLVMEKEDQEAKLVELAARPAELQDFLGHAKEKPSDPREGAASRLVVDDASLLEDPEIRTFEQSSIDRFTGGVRDQTGVLFEEEMLERPRLQLRLHIHPPREGDRWDESVRESFCRALRDLCARRLPVGARSMGTCTGTLRWEGPDAEAWASSAAQVGVPMQKGEGT